MKIVENALTARTSFGSPGLDIVLPGTCRIQFPSLPIDTVWNTGDCFHLQTRDTTVRGAFIDTSHLLINGPCEIQDQGTAVSSLSQDRRTLVGTTACFNADKINVDLDAIMQQRCRWLAEHVIPSNSTQ